MCDFLRTSILLEKDSIIGVLLCIQFVVVVVVVVVVAVVVVVYYPPSFTRFHKI